MLSREIEKEIQQENKVILNFTMRQVACLSVAVVCSVLISVFLGWDFTVSVYPCLAIGGLCFAFGWVKQDGIPMERILLRLLQNHLYQNRVRLYKTKNRYTMLLNREYDRRRQIDRKDRKLRKRQKRVCKERKKALKKSRIQKIM